MFHTREENSNFGLFLKEERNFSESPEEEEGKPEKTERPLMEK